METGEGNFLGDRQAADGMVLFQDQDLEPGPGQITGAGEAVVAGADDDGIVGFGHGLDSLKNSSEFRVLSAESKDSNED